ncbi:DNA-binding transcriptional regulator, MarR family [Micrococcales bacterium KH10]|nr:DNA-binding transcriptional regulator, MarR family [Micrococcales bacterium KH10]
MAGDMDRSDERNQLIDELLALQDAWESSAVPRMLQHLLEIDLTIQQLKVLAILIATDGDSTGQRLAETLGVSLATISGILDRLEAHDMIERSEDPRDRRIRQVRATTTGRETIHRILTSRPKLDEGPLAEIPLEDLRALTRGMRAVLRAAEQTSPVTAPAD